MNLGPNPTATNPAPTTGEAANIRAAITAGHTIYQTTAQWVGVVLADKALGIETDALPRKMKIGDGVTVWASLPYIGSTEVSDTTYNEATWNGVTDVAPSKNAVRDKFQTLGDASTKTTSSGGNEYADVGKVVLFGGGGGILATSFAAADAGKSSSLNATGVAFSDQNSVYLVYLSSATLTDHRTFTLPDASGVFALTSNLAAITHGGADPNGSVTATHLGQWCKATTAWWQWDGSAWIPRFLLNGKQITRDDADTAYFSLGVDAIGLPTTLPFP